MTMTAKQWRDLATGACELLGDSWRVAGTGHRSILVQDGVGWWLQFVGYENTRAGRLIAYSAFLGRPLGALQTGDKSGVISDHYVLPGDERPRMSAALLTPEGVAEWARAVARHQFTTVGDLHEELRNLDRLKIEWDAIEPFRNVNLQWLVALRIICGSRGPLELVADIDAVLADPTCDGYESWARAGAQVSSRREFFTELRGPVANGERERVQELVVKARAENLNYFAIPEEIIEPVLLPEPMVRQ